MIRLRKIEPEDLPFLYQWENDASAWADGANHNPLSQQDLREYIQSTSGDIYRDGQLRLIICDDKADNSLTMGCIDLFDFDPRNRKAAIGMYVAPQFRQRGVGRKAVLLLEDYAFSFLSLRLIYAVISTANLACTNLYKQLNFTPSSELPGWTLEGNAIIWHKFNNR